jgi:hypothetical protein
MQIWISLIILFKVTKQSISNHSWCDKECWKPNSRQWNGYTELIFQYCIIILVYKCSQKYHDLNNLVFIEMFLCQITAHSTANHSCYKKSVKNPIVAFLKSLWTYNISMMIGKWVICNHFLVCDLIFNTSDNCILIW